MCHSFRFCLAGLCLVVIGFGFATVHAQGSFVNFENPHNHPIDLSPDGSTLATCNTAANRIDLWDVTSGTPVFSNAVPVGYDPVSVRWRTNAEVWVVNHISDSISVVNPSTFLVSATIDTLDEPCDVVFAGSTERAFVSCSSVNIVQVFNPTTFAETGQVTIAAEDPRSLSVSADGTKVYAAIFESGNGTTLLFGAFSSFNSLNDPTNPYRGQNPPPNVDVAGFNTNLIDWSTDWTAEAANYFSPAPSADTIANRPPLVSLIVQDDGTGNWFDDNGVDWTSWVTGGDAATSGRFAGWSLVDRDVAIIDANNPTGVAVQYVERLMNHNMAVGVNPNTGDITVVGTDATNVIRFEPNLTGTFVRVNLAIIDPGDIANPTVVDLNEAHLTAAQVAQHGGGSTAYQDGSVPQTERDKSIGDPRAIEWNAAGTRGFIAGQGSNNLVVIDAAGARTSIGFTVELGEGPTGIVVDDVRQQVYTMNRFDGSISVVDISTAKAAGETARIPFFDPTPDAIKTGRVHLYGTHENSGLGQIACGSCHLDGRHDRLAWDLGDPSADIKPLDLINVPGDINGVLTPQHNPLFLPATLNDFHGMKGPMTTQTLRDIIGKEPLHWRGDKNGLEEFGGAFVGLQGDDAPLTGVPMQEFEDHLATIHFQPNAFRNLDNSLSTDMPLPRQFSNGRFTAEGTPMPNGNAANGLVLYRRPNMDGGVACVVCHTLPLGNSTDLFLDLSLNTHVIPPGPDGEAKLALFDTDGSDDRVMKVPQTRAIFDKSGLDVTGGGESLAGFGLFHDGASPSITDFVSSTVFNVLNEQEVADLVAFNFSMSGSFDTTPLAGEFPITQTSNDAHAAVGKQTTLDSASKSLAFLNQLVTEADTVDAFQVDLVAKSSEVVAGLGQVVRGWRYDAPSDLFVSDRADEPGITQATLLAAAAPGAEITFTATPLGTGVRLGIDRDGDGLSDFDEIRDLDLFAPGIQNPFDPDDADSTGDDGALGPDGMPDGQNDFDNDGGDNDTEFGTIGGTPIGEGVLAGLPAFQNWGLIITVMLMACAVLATATVLRRAR